MKTAMIRGALVNRYVQVDETNQVIRHIEERHWDEAHKPKPGSVICVEEGTMPSHNGWRFSVRTIYCRDEQ